MKTMIVTGGARGIGAELVRHFSGGGWRVAFCWNTSVEAADILSRGTGAIALQCDVRSEDQVKDMLARARKQLGHIDALICNAGAAWSGLTEEMPLTEYERLADTNLRGAFLCVREALPDLLPDMDVIHICGKGNVDESLQGTPGHRAGRDGYRHDGLLLRSGQTGDRGRYAARASLHAAGRRAGG